MSVAGQTAAQDATHSALTTIELAKCKLVRQSAAEGSAWACEGLPGYPVHLAEVDDRTFLSFGRNAEQRRASRQTLGAPNTLFPSASKRATIEWRVPVATGSKGEAVAPYATIVRYTTARGAIRGQVLVVSKVTPSDACRVALIDADANADAVALARRIADTTARTFDCAMPPQVHGLAGKSPM